MTNTIDTFVKKCFTFNDVANKLHPLMTRQDLVNQLNLIKEELQETIDDLEAGDYVGVLDGYCDVMVTTVGLGMILDQLGFNTTEALNDTADNNLTKYLSFSDNITYGWDTLVKYEGKNVTAKFNPKYKLFYFTNDVNKIMKPVNFVSNDLSKHVPIRFLKEAA